MRGLVCCGALLGLTLATHARGADQAEPTASDSDAAAPVVTSRVWYGWQTLLVDAAAIGALAPAPAAWDHAAGVLGSVSAALFVTAPVMHALQHRWHAFGTSLALRVFIGFTGAAIGVAAGGGTCSIGCDLTTYSPEAEGLYIGALAGMAIASAIDAAVLGWRPRFELRSTPAWNILPSITPYGGGVSLVRAF